MRKRYTTVAVKSDTPGTAAGLMRRTASQAVARACAQQVVDSRAAEKGVSPAFFALGARIAVSGDRGQREGRYFKAVDPLADEEHCQRIAANDPYVQS